MEEVKMNIYQKLQKCRVDLQNGKMKKSGQNKFSHYDYFELGDFLPKINELMDKYGLASIFKYTSEQATLTIVNTNKIEEKIEFATPIQVAELKGCYGIQNIGATQTYARRYLYIMAFEIAEHDIIDDGSKTDETAMFNAKKIDGAKAKTIKQIVEDTKTDLEVFLKYYHVKKVEDITNGNFKSVMDGLEKKKAKIEENQAKLERAKEQKGQQIPVDLGI